MDDYEFRDAGPEDASAIAALHADSWRRHYRGAYTDEFLDGDVVADRLMVWTHRLRGTDEAAQTVVAETGATVVGFAHTILDTDPTWGALLDNLHVAGEHHRRGVGAELMVRSASFVVATRPRDSMYLWVLEQNSSAQLFYDAIGGARADSAPVPPVSGIQGRLEGTPVRLRYVWRHPAVLTERRVGRARSAPCGRSR